MSTAEFPRRFGSYVLLKPLARGGMGELDLAVTGGQGMVTVMSTRYGSLCSTAIAAHHHEAGNQLTIEVTFSQRAALCAADIRAITYRAEISGLSPGAYDVHVVHTNVDGTTGTTLSQRVTVT